MIKKTNKRIHITLSKEQEKWLQNFCKKHDITPSKYISYLLVKKADEMINVLKIDSYDLTMEELERIVKTPWVK